MLLPSNLFRIVICCKIVNISIKFKFNRKIFVIQEMIPVFCNLLRGPDVTSSGAGSEPRVVHPWFSDVNHVIEERRKKEVEVFRDSRSSL